MVRSYIRKTNRPKWNENSMRNAVLAGSKKELSIRKAVDTYGTSKSALHRHIANKQADQDMNSSSSHFRNKVGFF